MIVGVCGIKRSGSTAQYNMVRLILETLGPINTTGDSFNFVEGINLYKTHVFNKTVYNKSDYIFTTDRDRVEIMQSLERFNTGTIKPMSVMVMHLNKWKQKSLHQDYKDIVNNPRKCIEEITEHLGVQVDIDDIYNKFKSIKPESEYNPKTMLFPNHITK